MFTPLMHGKFEVIFIGTYYKASKIHVVRKSIVHSNSDFYYRNSTRRNHKLKKCRKILWRNFPTHFFLIPFFEGIFLLSIIMIIIFLTWEKKSIKCECEVEHLSKKKVPLEKLFWTTQETCRTLIINPLPTYRSSIDFHHQSDNI